jgi:hypothetical protein
MGFQVGPVNRSLRAWGYPIKDEAGALIAYVEFATREEGERACTAMQAALSDAASIRDASGKEWTAKLSKRPWQNLSRCILFYASCLYQAPASEMIIALGV